MDEFGLLILYPLKPEVNKSLPVCLFGTDDSETPELKVATLKTVPKSIVVKVIVGEAGGTSKSRLAIVVCPKPS